MSASINPASCGAGMLNPMASACGAGQLTQQTQQLASGAMQMAMGAVMTAMAGLMKSMFSQAQGAGMMPFGGCGQPFGGTSMMQPQSPCMPGQNLLGAASLLLGATSLLQQCGCKPGAGAGAGCAPGAGGATGATGAAGAAGAAKTSAKPEAKADAKTTVNSGVPDAPNTVPNRNDKPVGNHSIDKYMDANNGLLRNLGNQEGMKDKLKERYGDWGDPKRSEADRKQSAYNAARHVGCIKHKKAHDGDDRGSVTKNGKMEGATKSGDIRAGTEMAALKDSLKGTGKAQDENVEKHVGSANLAKTNDRHVRKNGTNMDNAERVGRDVGSAVAGGLSKAFETVSSVVGNTLGRIPGIGKLLSAPAETLCTAASGGFNVAKTAADGGDVKQAAKKMGYDTAQTAVTSTVGIVDPTGVGASVVGDQFRGIIDKNHTADAGKAATSALNPLSGITG